MRRFLSLGVAGLAACSSTADPQLVKQPSPPLPQAGDIKVELPDIPAKIDITTSQPMEGNQPAKRSPVLDELKSEADREMAALGKQAEPAYYLAYQVVEQRVVSLEAEGGAIITDQDETSRNLDVDVRVGSP